MVLGTLAPSTAIDPLMPALTTISSSLVDGKTNLGNVEAELNKISVATQTISTSFSSVQTVIDQYKTVTTQLKVQVEAIQLAAPGWMTAITWIVTFILAWTLIAQLGLAAQGLDMLRGRPEAKKDIGFLEPRRTNTDS